MGVAPVESAMADVHRQLDVPFAGPYRLFGHTGVLPDCPHARQAGIYLWAVQQPQGQFLVSYVGVTCRSFQLRAFEAVLGHVNGYDDICDADGLRAGRRTVLWEGLWRSKNRNKVGQVIDQLPSIAQAAQASISSYRLFVAPLQLPKQLLERCEGAITCHLRARPASSLLMAPDIRYHIRKADETAVPVAVTSEAHVRGFPVSLLA